MSLSGLHILVAEDNPTNQMVAEQMLLALGATTELAADGEAALELARTRRFDLALIDIEMPKLSGTDVIRQLREMGPPWSEMPLVALTAYVMREHRQAIEEAGADGLIAKPILSLEDLAAEIQRILGQARSRRRGAVRLVSSTEPRSASATPEAKTKEPEPQMDLAAFDSLSRSIGEAATRDLLGKMDRDILRARRQVEQGLDRKAAAPLRDASHVLVAIAGSVGAVKLQTDAQCLNSAAHSGDTSEMERLGERVLAEIHLLRAFIRSRV